MKPSLLYRLSAVLLALFTLGHTLGFSASDPSWGIDALLASMRSLHFEIQGFHRTYWDFFLGNGYSVSVFFLFAAVLAWQLSRLPSEALAQLRLVRWSFALSFALNTVVSVRYLFIIPIAFSGAITVCLTAAAWRGGRSASAL